MNYVFKNNASYTKYNPISIPLAVQNKYSTYCMFKTNVSYTKQNLYLQRTAGRWQRKTVSGGVEEAEAEYEQIGMRRKDKAQRATKANTHRLKAKE